MTRPFGAGSSGGRNEAGWAAATAVRKRSWRKGRNSVMGGYRRLFRAMARRFARPYVVGAKAEAFHIMDDKTRTELEAAVYRRLVEHLRQRTDVQNIDLMNLAGFCRNCLSNWMKDAADEKGIPMSKDESREIVYGEPYEQWRARNQKEA